MMLLGVDLGGVLLERKGGSSELAGLKRDGEGGEGGASLGESSRFGCCCC